MSLPRFLNDVKFLSQLDKLPVKEEYVRITVLDWEENPIQQIQGIVINGSVNLDGNSSMRRTASLTVFAEQTKNDLKNINSLFAINKKCKIEKGIRNTVPPYYNEPTNEFINYQEEYGQVVWFPLGLYVMFNPALSHQMTGVNISMQLKDKMCLLNGDLGGQIHSSVQFHIKDQIVDNNGSSVRTEKNLVYDIIKQLVNHWGNESLNKIFITEVPPMIKQVVKWIGSQSVYIIMSDKQTQTIYTDNNAALEEANRIWNEMTTEQRGNRQAKDLIVKLQPGRDVGFIYTPFVYPGQLVCNAGDTITSVLDKIIGILGNYEYFYDVEGNFIFQEKRNNLNMSHTAVWGKDGDTIDLPHDAYTSEYTRLSKPIYDFSDNRYFTAYNNTLNYNNIKNDFIVWGSRKLEGTNSERIIRFHLSIDMKPRYNQDGSPQQYSCMLYMDDHGTVRGKYILDKILDADGKPIDITSEEQIKRPVQYGFYKINGKYYQYVPKSKNSNVYQFKQLAVQGDQDYNPNAYPRLNFMSQPKDWREQLYYQMLEDEKWGTGVNDIGYHTYFQYYAEMKEQFPKIFNLQTHKYYSDYYSQPDTIDYFLDMIDADTELGKYSIHNIGKRTLVIANNNEGLNCIFEPEIIDLVYVVNEMYTDQEYETLQKLLQGYKQKWIQIPSYIYNSMSIGGRKNSCYEKIKDLLYQYTEMNQTISITSLPIYYLEPNTRITVNDDASGIYGDYIIQSISLPLDISSTMSINAYKALNKI